MRPALFSRKNVGNDLTASPAVDVIREGKRTCESTKIASN